MDRYTARMNLHGTTQRERLSARLKTELSNKLSGNLSTKDVLLNGVETKLVINTGTKPYYKEFQAFPNQQITMGDYVEWANRTWLVYEADADDEFYINGKMYECNYKLYWQDENGKIVSKACFVQNASSYNNGEEANKVITLASNQFMVWMPLDNDTLNLRNGKRIFIDNYEIEPYCYKLTRPDNVSMKFGNKGCTYYIFTQTETDKSVDKQIELEDGTKVWLADYVTPTTSDDDSDETDVLLSYISGNPTLKVDVLGAYTATLLDSDGKEVEWDDTLHAWRVVSDFDVISKGNGNQITLMVEDEDCIDSSFILRAVKASNDSIYAQIEITVAGMF